MNRALTLYLKGAGMGAADAVPGVSGGTIAFITGIYEELIHTIRRFGPEAIGVWREGGTLRMLEFLNFGFLIPLMLGILTSLVTVAHLVTYLMDAYPLLLNAFFFGLVLASAYVVARRLTHWNPAHLVALVAGVALAYYLPSLLPAGNDGGWMLFIAGAIAISAMLLPGVSGSFLLLTMGMYGTVMGGIKSFDLMLIVKFALGCLVGLFTFSRVLSWLFKHHHAMTLQLLIGFILGSLPTLWPWKTLSAYRLADNGDKIPLDHQLLWPNHYGAVTGSDPQWVLAFALMAVGVALVVALGERNAPSDASGEK
ncbi:DUF368 domain-containing protein [Larsenimonas suaedae]|uniref:DUF368 domain-containing protein n=1 Tax=Larsenimonas suaedae TaxID=1851019 RepID=A0ABU1GWK1_9GAMM|nr:DUF368 domain-containing protein [Larsenimonas suaedae]MCM2973001.1 DUF368 domain-containing protein [Larsenimonas suaedae]MDR5896438.1 DUF368 domain-containing protein [Larsenimonas suaedae]